MNHAQHEEASARPSAEATRSSADRAVSIEERVFGTGWEKRSCTVSEAKAYFKARFGLGHTAFYEILRPRLRLRALMPSHLGRGLSVGLVLFADEVVSECDTLEADARRDTRSYSR